MRRVRSEVIRGGASRLAIGSLLAMVAIASTLVAAPVTQAAPAYFAYEMCDSQLPGGNTPGATFTVNPGVAIGAKNTCAEPNGSLQIIEWGHAKGTFAYWSVPIPAVEGGWIESVTVTGAACGLGPGNDHTFVYEQPFPGNLCAESPHYFPVDSGPSFFSAANVTLFMNCNGNYAPGCEAGPAIFAHYIAAVEVDPTAPTIASIEGSVLSGEILRGHQTLGAAASDKGGGLTKLSVLVNGLPAADPQVGNCGLAQVKNLSYTGTVALTPHPCPGDLAGAWTLDTTAYPFHDGANSVQVCASDLATSGDPNTGCSAAQTVQVNNSCTESTVSGGQSLSARFAASDGDVVTVPYGKATEVAGQLSNSAGDPISGATICVMAVRQGVEGSPRPIATAKTDAQGDFNYQLDPGPNRRLLVGYRHDSFQVAKALDYHASARPELKLKPGRVQQGGQVTITGKVPGPGAGGCVVILQAASLHGHRWLTFRRATTGPLGRFVSHYKFGSSSGPITYRIRAFVPPQRSYPFDPGHSVPARVKVLGR